MATKTRREFLLSSTITGTGLVIAMLPATGAAAEGNDGNPEKDEKAKKDESKPEEGVSPAEDLMREHGALERILLIYGEGARRLRADRELPPKVLADTAEITRAFVEDYHEKLEEDYLFPRFRKAGKLVDLVDVLFAQHQAGRRLTDAVLALATATSLEKAENRRKLSGVLRAFIRMYRPHAAREETVLFPAFRGLVSAREYDRLGDDFENQEHQRFGADGFEKTVERIASIEKSLGIYDLGQFTPKE